MRRVFSSLLALALVVASAKAWSDELDWVFECGQPAHRDYFTDVEHLQSSDASVQAVRDALHARLPTLVLGTNQACLYEVVLRFGDEATMALLQARVRDNGRPFKIDEEYFKALARDDEIPAHLLSRLKTIKGRSYANAQAYEAALRRLLTQEDHTRYGHVILRAGRLDPDNHSQDLHHLLRTRDQSYPLKDDFIRQLASLKHATSRGYFLERHLQELDVPTRLEVLLHVKRRLLRKHPGFDYLAAAQLGIIHQAHPGEYRSFVSAHREGLPEVFLCVIDGSCP